MASPQHFYTKLTVRELSKKKKGQNKKELSFLKMMLSKKSHILDLGCGYGRLTIPLKKEGFNIEGIDITPYMIKKAKELAKRKNLKIKFKIGDMKNLPYKNDSFDTIICMWSVFMEVSNRKDQIKTLSEMKRILKTGGFSLIDLPPPYRIGKRINDTKKGDKSKVGKDRILRGKISNISFPPAYSHNKKSLTSLMRKSKIKKFEIYNKNFFGINRLILKFWKS